MHANQVCMSLCGVYSAIITVLSSSDLCSGTSKYFEGKISKLLIIFQKQGEYKFAESLDMKNSQSTIVVPWKIDNRIVIKKFKKIRKSGQTFVRMQEYKQIIVYFILHVSMFMFNVLDFIFLFKNVQCGSWSTEVRIWFCIL